MSDVIHSSVYNTRDCYSWSSIDNDTLKQEKKKRRNSSFLERSGINIFRRSSVSRQLDLSLGVELFQLWIRMITFILRLFPSRLFETPSFSWQSPQKYWSHTHSLSGLCYYLELGIVTKSLFIVSLCQSRILSVHSCLILTHFGRGLNLYSWLFHVIHQNYISCHCEVKEPAKADKKIESYIFLMSFLIYSEQIQR